MRRFTFVAGGLAISGFALWIRLGRPHESSAVLAFMVNSEACHILAHCVLYGTLAWFGARALPLRWVVPAVLVLGGVQELAQVVGDRAPSWPELFDLGVDAGAALVVVVLIRRWPAFPFRPPRPTMSLNK